MSSIEHPPLKQRVRNASPNEELTIRQARVAPRLTLSDDQFAVLLYTTRLERVEDDGAIRFEIGNQPYEFYHVDAITCATQRGKQVVVAYSPDMPDMIFVLTADGAFVEPIPCKRALPWFNYEQLGQEIREQQITLQRAARELEEVHGPDIRQKTYAGRGNVEKVENWRDGRITQILPQPEPLSASTKSHTDAAPAGNDRPRELDALGGDQARPLLPAEPDADSPASSAPRQPASPEFSTDSVADEEVPALNPEPRSLTGAAPTISRALPSSDPASRIAAATAHARTRVATVADQQRAAADAIADVEQSARRSRRQRIAAKYGQPVS
jgi:hypothetical protein